MQLKYTKKKKTTTLHEKTLRMKTGNLCQVLFVQMWLWLCVIVWGCQWWKTFLERLQNKTSSWTFFLTFHKVHALKCIIPFIIKSVVGREEYLDLIKLNIYKTALAQFRLGMSLFNAHRLRYSLSEENRACPFCPDKVQDEAHILSTATCMETWSETCT